MKKTILILTIGFGAGHRRAASTLARMFAKELPDCDPQIVDVAAFMSHGFRWIYVDLYLWILSVAPILWKWMERFQRRRPQTAPSWIFRSVAKRIFAAISHGDIAALVSTEVGVNEIAAILKRKHLPRTPLLAVLTDYDVDRAWVRDEVNVFCVGASVVREELVSAGVPPEKIVVTGIPVEEGFQAGCPRDSAPQNGVGAAWGLRILMAGGGEGLGRIRPMLQSLHEIIQSASVTILVGQNQRLHQKLLSLNHLTHLRVDVQGWTDNMPEQLHQHDLLISKPGGITLTEAMAAGLPMLACFPLPGSEVKHCVLIEQWGVGLAATTLEEFRKKAQELLMNGSLRTKFSENCRRIYREQHQQSVAQVLRRLI